MEGYAETIEEASGADALDALDYWVHILEDCVAPDYLGQVAYEFIESASLPAIWTCTCTLAVSLRSAVLAGSRMTGTGCSPHQLVAKSAAAFEVIVCVHETAPDHMPSLPRQLFPVLDLLATRAGRQEGQPSVTEEEEEEEEEAESVVSQAENRRPPVREDDSSPQLLLARPVHRGPRCESPQLPQLPPAARTVIDLSSEPPSPRARKDCSDTEPASSGDTSTALPSLLALHSKHSARPDITFYERFISLFSDVGIPLEAACFSLPSAAPAPNPMTYSGGMVFFAHGDEAAQRMLNALGLGGGRRVLRGEVRGVAGKIRAKEAAAKMVWMEVGRWLARGGLEAARGG